MAIDWDRAVLAPVMAVFGEDKPVNYRPSSGQPFDLIDAVFDEAYHELQMIDESADINTSRPVLGVRLGLFSIPPKQGDQVFVPKVNSTYAVRDSRPDGHGHALLLLNFVSSP
ncbi:hypothetical protein [Telmatospirillum sp.]|uniref:head-tail joining protein n=1 Tax=Telmatospirillum sp. TaxID=2079197 RepID=UPI002843FE11|nr:hypothetical protein [Telmatospirillum sp.]MDR3438955.1 hypothetical protein [Telmatospirillum sp.]